ncbi:hypothetical protein M406DRAFT_356546 [Cryphonectria parasitica EP155]|uniref:Uncharacterized protein n=1 Tax=Cryphonectria parasitica (strain ATCC 38755 / EP155) TaxID=660469 RepID=A0A9P4Y0T6_CRYP1|nr:uncharacterized protein M406DRAFT_356546 [Cryphonectria parasitica EP155]KAF3764429.1 hypothetical protein M406DRAFT_356546 [Cryphonectria parasitica EP155]
MKTTFLALLCIAASATTAFVIPSPRQSPLVQDNNVAITEPSAQEIPETEIVVDDFHDNQQDVEPMVESCFCAGGSICCNLTGGETDCGFGTCGI